MLSSIVVPIDGSDLSKSALPVGEQLARALGSTLTLLTSGWGSTVEELHASLAAEAAKFDIPTAISVVPDTFPATAISHAVAGTDDAVVMATHGRSGIGKALLGSVAEDLLKVTERPVLLLGPSAGPLPTITGGVMVVSTDGGATSAAILPRAARWAVALELSVRIVAVTKADGTPHGELSHDELLALMEAAADVFRAEGLTADVETLTGHDPAAAIVEFAKHLPATMLAMSTHARTGWDRTALGSVAMKVVHDAPCPVLVQQPARGLDPDGGSAPVSDGYRAWQLAEPGPATDAGPLRRVDGPVPTPGAGEVLIEVHACAVCRTDLQLVEGDLPARATPVVPGHQIVGTVVTLGDGVRSHVVGDRVGVAWIAGTCGHCRFCASGRENLCESARFTGWDHDGGYATHTTARADFVHRLPDGVDDLDAAPLLCGGVIGFRSLRVAGMGPGRRGARLGLYGFGASATCVIQVAVHWGLEVHVCTRSEREQDAARALGATWAGGYDELPPVPLDAAITFAPSGDVVAAALKALDRGGVVAVNAIHLDRLPEMPYDDLWWERSIRSVANVTRDDVREFLDLAAAIPVRTRTEVLPLDEAGTALRRLAAGDVSGSFVLRIDPERPEDGAGARRQEFDQGSPEDHRNS